MKVYNKIVLDIDGNVIEEDSFEYEGPVAKCGGGSATNAADYPSYIKDTHHNWLKGDSVDSGDAMTNSIVDLMDNAQGSGNNPYESGEGVNETAFDPNAALSIISSSPIDRIDDRFTTTQLIIDALDADTDWASYITTAATKFGSFADIDFLDSLSTEISAFLSAISSALSDASITNMVTTFENNKKVRFLRDQGLWSASMAVGHSAFTSSFIMGLAVQQIEFSNSVDAYEAQLKKDVYTNLLTSGFDAYMKANVLRVQNKDNMLLDGAKVMALLEQFKGQVTADLTRIKAEIERIVMISMKEKTDKQLEIDVGAAEWDFEVYQYGANMLAAVAGGVIQKGNRASTGQSALSGALAGASIGKSFGPVGAGIGAAAGLILGWALG